MIQIRLQDYITLGRNLATLRRLLEAPPALKAYAQAGDKTFTPSTAVVAVMGQLRDVCGTLGLSTTRSLLDHLMANFKHVSQLEVLIAAAESELNSRLVLHIPSERARYWERGDLLSERARATFPVAVEELRAAGTAFACGLWNSTVFHAMRAAEDGLIAIVERLDIDRTGGEQWGKLIDQIEKKLGDIAKLPRVSQDKRQWLGPLSEQVIDLRLFKDAWRNQNAHAIVAYNDGNALNILQAVCRVLDRLAADDIIGPGHGRARITENPVSSGGDEH